MLELMMNDYLQIDIELKIRWCECILTFEIVTNIKLKWLKMLRIVVNRKLIKLSEFISSKNRSKYIDDNRNFNGHLMICYSEKNKFHFRNKFLRRDRCQMEFRGKFFSWTKWDFTLNKALNECSCLASFFFYFIFVTQKTNEFFFLKRSILSTFLSVHW